MSARILYVQGCRSISSAPRTVRTLRDHTSIDLTLKVFASWVEGAVLGDSAYRARHLGLCFERRSSVLLERPRHAGASYQMRA